MWYGATWQIGRNWCLYFDGRINKKSEGVGSSETLVRICLCARLHGNASRNTKTLPRCFPNRVPWNPRFGQDTVRGSVRNHRTNIQVFWNTAKNYKYTPKYHKNFIKQLAILVQTAACLFCFCFHRQWFLGIQKIILQVSPWKKFGKQCTTLNTSCIVEGFWQWICKAKLENLNPYKQETKNDTEIHTHHTHTHTAFSPAVIRIPRLPQEH